MTKGHVWTKENLECKPGTGCWEWTRSKTFPQPGKGNGGYGKALIDGKWTMVARLAWEEMNGPIPEGMVIRHKCHNPPCCNPAHLLIGTHQDNMDDLRRAGRKTGYAAWGKEAIATRRRRSG